MRKPCLRSQADDNRHKDVVEQHGGNGHRFHHYHAGCGGKTSQEGKHGNSIVAGGKGDADNEEIRAG